MIRKKQQLINEATGEIIAESSECFNDAMNEDGYRIPSHKMGARMFADVPFPDGMTDREIGKMSRITKSRAMIGKTNMLGYRKGREILPYTAQEIGELVGLVGSKARSFVSRMCKLHVMQRVATQSGQQYYVNPAYFMANGQRLSLDLFLLFRKDLALIVPSWVMRVFLSQADEKGKTGLEALNQAESIIYEVREQRAHYEA